MEPRNSRSTKTDPKIRQIGFTFNSSSETQQNPHSQSLSTTLNSGAMIPLPISAAETSTSLPVPVPATAIARRNCDDNSNSYLAASSPDSIQREYSDEWVRSSSGKYSLAFDMSGVNSPVAVNSSEDGDVTAVNHEIGANTSEVQVPQNDVKLASKPLKDKTSKAERRALQEAQRAAKAAKKAVPSEAAARISEKETKVSKQTPQKKDFPPATSSVAVVEKKGSDRPSDKDKKKDIPPPRMQYDDESRVEKAKKRSVFKQTEARKVVELFRHLPQYEHGSQLHDLESRIFNLDSVHPAVYTVGLQYISGNISGSNARCIAMLSAFKEAIEDYHTPPDKIITRDLTARISSYVSFLNECRPLSISMGNAIRYLKTRIAKLPSNLSESETKATLSSNIDRFIKEKIVVADKVIVQQAATKVRDGDVLLTYGCSSAVELVILYAHELGKKFRVVIVDSRPKLQGQGLLRRLVAKGLRCTYTHINAVSYVMHEVTRVFLGAASILSNGMVYSRIGTACVAMVAHSFRVPVLVCCEAYKFHERVLLDSICSNELGDPGVIAKVPGRKDVPPTSVPVIVREYGKEHLF
ncbi:Translation initiation factor eIF-2B subunit delta [Bienertia sinuspersici]